MRIKMEMMLMRERMMCVPGIEMGDRMIMC